MTGKPTWTVREGTDADLDGLRDLYLRVWGYNRPRQYDHWRYFMPPVGICPMALAVDGERIVGAYSLWPVNIWAGGQSMPGAQSMDTMTDPNYGRQGIFSTLAEACYEIAEARGFQVLYGFPNPHSYPGFTRKLGWTHTGDMTHWVRPIRPSGHARVPKIARPLADLATRLLPKGRRHNLDITTSIPDANELNELISGSAENGATFSIERSAAWFDWRYADAAENNYRWLSAYRDGRLIATGVWGKQNASWGDVCDRRAHLVELLGQDSQGLEAVLFAVIEDATKAHAIVLETICNIAPINSALRRAGFFRHRQAPFIVRGLGDKKTDSTILNHPNWRIMGGDIDTF